jgi:hypothetical protein
MADLSVTAANVAPVLTGSNPTKVAYGTAGATITQGQSVYLDATTNLWGLAKADTLVHSGSGGVGIALTSASANQPIAVAVGGDITCGGTSGVGTTYAVSAATAGAIAPIADPGAAAFITVIGVGISATVIRMPQAGPLVSGIAHA